MPVGVLSGPKAKRAPVQGRCLHRPATPAAAPMLPGGRNRPPYRLGQTAGGTGNVVPMTSIYLSCRPFAADRRAGVHARRLGLAALPVGVLSGPKAKRAPVPGTMPASSRNPCGGSNAARRAKSPALQYKAKTTSLRQGPPSRHSFPVNCRAGVHARRKTFRSCGFSGLCLLLPANPPPATSPCAKTGVSRRAPTPLPPDFLSTPPACGPPKFLIPNF